jgi:biopolymer transport protein ExbD
MKIRTLPIRSPRIEMLPLIDVVFLLLVVFIYAMLSMAVHRGLPVALPTSSSAQVESRSILSITVTAQGDLFVDKEPVKLQDLGTVLEQRAAQDRQAGVLLFADRMLPYQDLFRVLDQVRRAGLSHISLQAETQEPP